ncbi:MAG TPA: CHASE domain-containing protein [Erythrobacter sp.]|nr:CHASE domain-containing protein [Erythrobacter sp.]
MTATGRRITDHFTLSPDHASAGLPPPPASGRARRWLVLYPRAIPLAIFAAIAAITALSVFAIESNARSRERAQMREYAQSVAAALDRSSSGFSSYLRAGAALFSSLEEVQPETFDNFVRALKLNADDTGAEGVGWIPVIEARDLPAFLASTRARQPDFPDITPAPNAATGRIAPVVMFAPVSERSRRALGYDMYSDPARAAAMAEAELTLRPAASGRITLEQETSGSAPAFAIYMPAFRLGEGANGSGERQLAGFVYTPFRAREFLDSALAREAPSGFGVRLYDGEISTGHLLVAHSIDAGANQTVEQQVTIADRKLMLVIESPDGRVLSPLSMVTLMFGLALASLLMLLARLLTQQAFEDQTRLAFFEEQHSIRNSLTRELNHRVKNTLANVLSILSLTRRRASGLDEFADSLEGRIRALSATHDLLTVTDWGTTPIRAVIEAELQHFRVALGDAILLEGPELELAPNDALSFGLAVHELATNAAKYGALSVATGQVRIRWQRGEDLAAETEWAEVEWQETGGPPVPTERRRGFGTELIEKVVAHELRQPVTLDFAPMGVRCVLRVPIRRPADFRIRER